MLPSLFGILILRISFSALSPRQKISGSLATANAFTFILLLVDY